MQMARLEGYVRDHLNQTAPRLFVLLDPIKVNITNLPYGHIEEITVSCKFGGDRILPFSRFIYIDASDFRKDPHPDFFRLTVGGVVGLLNVPFGIKCTSVIHDSTGKIVEIQAEYLDATAPKPKTYIQWVGESARHSSPVPLEIRLYDSLFIHSDPDNKDQVPGGWLSDLNPESLQVKRGFGDVGVRSVRVEDKVQFVRVGYFCCDKDSGERGLVFNRTVGLKEDSKKN